ncbi:hypothetical protein LT173_002672 [Enterococcus faecalis]|uniref:hypothetical protein n=1 Tax=Enterococcus faecalis TaxID=1351 RepID=UPI0015E49021|nr:hypothetical protein [Enterococcus faecalis]EGO8187719.1 hypothetical protein [Enterococcus faecalis]EGS7980692.1 hypothetical protein [Enterococcus faecalis]EIP8075077.1 hypothetical protein [Enterococcus faecalis]EKA3597833.1 hypothetical protein [Enterococcus faecalis]EKR9304321.1 hypothetical protein [Enterococcus faecalis]
MKKIVKKSGKIELMTKKFETNCKPHMLVIKNEVSNKFLSENLSKENIRKVSINEWRKRKN